MTAFGRGLTRFWSLPEVPFTLPLTRIVLCLFASGYLLPSDMGRLLRLLRRPPEFFDPPAVLAWLPLPPSEPVVVAFGVVMLALGLLAAVGLLTRPALLLFGLGYLYLGVTIASWGYFPHSRLLPVQVLFILAFAPGSTAWSLDRLLRWWRQRRDGSGRDVRRDAPSLRAALAGTPVPRWGTQLILVLIVLLFFSAGVSKLRYSGLAWADGQTLSFYLNGGTGLRIPNPEGNGYLSPDSTWREGFSQFVASDDPTGLWKDGVGLEGYLYRARPEPLGQFLASIPWAVTALSVFSLMFELASPLLLLGPFWRNLYLFGAVAFFVGIDLTLSVGFLGWIPICLTMIEWRWFSRFFAARGRTRAAAST